MTEAEEAEYSGGGVGGVGGACWWCVGGGVGCGAHLAALQRLEVAADAVILRP